MGGDPRYTPVGEGDQWEEVTKLCRERIDKGKTKIKEARNMQEAVNVSYSLANSGDTVLLSPACASFDLFANFEERGLAFKAQVRKL